MILAFVTFVSHGMFCLGKKAERCPYLELEIKSESIGFYF